jgi:hypothetical protein
MKKSKIEKNLLDKAAQEFIEVRNQRVEQRMLVNKSTRLTHFEKNFKKK